ncbi:hypothetical protein EJ08DRAFT_329624 [Tothia fuscella]|uniref:Uncharacterized protein n=1 Tax=Tothia fuscella TaxID=1048955 RepID=A0A9P4NME3_9PEZI|nr:hypothetical protein EJ08DRAFT_329624 [Tothia fuscella]
MAAQNGRTRSAQLLIEIGAAISAERKGHCATKGRSIIEAAKKARSREIVKFLETAAAGQVLVQSDKIVGELLA